MSALALSGCTVALRRDHDQCATSADCQRLGAGAICTSERLCATLDDPLPRRDACAGDADCGDELSVCVDGECRALDTAGCVALGRAPQAGKEDRLRLAVLAPSTQRGDRLASAAQVAIDAWNRLAGDSPDLPPVVAVKCNELEVAALEERLDDRVVAFIGPMTNAAIDLAAPVVRRRATLFTPFAEAPSWRRSAVIEGNIQVSCKPNRQGASASLIEAFDLVRKHLPNDAEAVLALSLEETSRGYGSFGERAQAASIGVVSYDEQQPGGFADSLELNHPEAALVMSASGEIDWADNLVTLDLSRQLAVRPLPFYLLHDRQTRALDRIARDGSDPPRVERVAVLDAERSAANERARDSLAGAFQALTGSSVEYGFENVYDCTHVAILAAVAAGLRFSTSPRNLPPDAIALGISALVAGADEIALSEEGLSTLADRLKEARGATHALDLIGSSGNLDFDTQLVTAELAGSQRGVLLSPARADEALWCVNGRDRSYCDTGIRFPASGGDPRGESRCPCFPPP